MKSGITVECVSSMHHQETLSFEAAAKLTGPPTCKQCGMPMVAISAAIKTRRKKRDIRPVMNKVGRTE